MQRGRGGRKPPAGSNKRKDGGRLWAPAWPARASSAPMENAGMAPRRGRTKGLRGRPEREPIQLMTGGKTGSRSLVLLIFGKGTVEGLHWKRLKNPPSKWRKMRMENILDALLA